MKLAPCRPSPPRLRPALLPALTVSPLAVPGVPVLDQVKALDGPEAAQKLPALILSQVVGQAAHEDAVGVVVGVALWGQGGQAREQGREG